MSEKTLDNLIKTLKVEAIEAAEKEAASILETAKKEAKVLLEKAAKEKEQIVHVAQKEAQSTLEKGRSALRQAARDVNIALKNEIVQLLQTVFERNVEKDFSPELLKGALTKVIENIGSGIELRFSSDFKDNLANYVQRELQMSEKDITLLKEDGLKKGLNIVKTNEGWSYEVSAATVTELMGAQLNNEWRKLLKIGLKQ